MLLVVVVVVGAGRPVGHDDRFSVLQADARQTILPFDHFVRRRHGDVPQAGLQKVHLLLFLGPAPTSRLAATRHILEGGG